MRDPRPVLAVFVILFLLFAPDSPAQVQQHIARLDDVTNHERDAIGTLNGTYYGDFSPGDDRWLNLTGFDQDTGFGWSYLNDFLSSSANLTEHALGERFDDKALGQPAGRSLPLYKNITGVVHGEWLRNEWPTDLPPPAVNRSQYLPPFPSRIAPDTPFARNLTGQEGFLSVRFVEDEGSFDIESRQGLDGTKVDVARYVTARVAIESTDGTGDDYWIRVHGVHFLETGHIILTTTSDKFDGFYGLPHLTWSPYFFRIAQSLVTRVVNITIERQQAGAVRLFSPFSSATDGASDSPFSIPQCDLVVAMQQQPIPLDDALTSTQQSTLLADVENQLRSPTGIGSPTPSEMSFSFTAFSPDCGYVLSSTGPPAISPAIATHLTGIKLEVEELYARHHLILYMFVLGGQLFFLTRQMKDACAPSVRSRISFYTIAMMNFGDFATAISLGTISNSVPGLWALLMACFFLAFMSGHLYGMRLLQQIWSVQAPERERRPLPPAGVPPPATPQSQPQSQTVPPSAAPPQRMLDTGSVPVVLPGEQPTLPIANRPPTAAPEPSRDTFGGIATRVFLLTMALFFLTLNAATWPYTLRRMYFMTIFLLYLSFWVPQIYRNAWRNCRRALRWEFVVGQTVLRLAPLAYFYGYRWNVLFAKVDLIDLCILVGWCWLQLLALVSQEILGPRWFVGQKWLPPAYDYHPLLKEDEEGGNLPVGGVEGDDGVRAWDCAVCMQPVEVQVHTGDAEAGLAGATGLLARRAYMMTPCRHIFHAKCLEGWLKYRLQCPICREDLPPV